MERVRVIDWNRPGENEFFLAKQLWVTGPYQTKRLDVIGFVNGLPLLLVELKKPGVHVQEAYEKNLEDYKEAIPQLFWYNGLVALSNGKDARVGSITAPWDHFGQWKRVEREDEAGRLGVFWHTQGSGKSYSMLFFSQKVLRKIRGNWTFVIVTDRRDLDDQIYQVFANAGAVTEPEKTVRAQSGAHLKELLRQDHRYVFTLIHKFHTKPGETYPTLSQRGDIIVITDEAHRSQYDVLARNMRDALPNAAFIDFTGTPLMAEGEELTREVFGDYVSIYNFKQSIEDEATVALYYENRIPEVQIINEDFDEELERILEEAALDEAQEQRLARQFAREYHIITRDERLERIAADIVQHFMGRGYRGKAMVVSIDKLTAGRMHEKVKRHWGRQLAILRADWEDETDAARRAELAEDIAFMAETEMALVVSQGQNEIKQFRERGLDIRPHRKRMNEAPLDEYFKDPAHPLRIVFVCAMWMMGFDVPSCSTIYLDKPMRNHTLMQTIARANRVYGQKNNGLIVDYIGVFRNLQRALAIYATSEGGLEGGERPIKPKAALVEELEEALGETAEFCARRGVDIETITSQDAYFKRLEAVEAAADKLLVNDQTKDEFLALARWVNRLYKAILPDKRANPYRAERDAIKGIADYIQSEIEPPDVSGVMAQVEDLLDRSIGVEGFVIRETADAPFNLSQIDFEALSISFSSSCWLSCSRWRRRSSGGCGRI